MKRCLLDETKFCDNCGECDCCDLNPDKLCDNCCKCLESEGEYLRVEISDVVINDPEEYLEEYFSNNDSEDS